MCLPLLMRKDAAILKSLEVSIYEQSFCEGVNIHSLGVQNYSWFVALIITYLPYFSMPVSSVVPTLVKQPILLLFQIH